MPDREFTCRCAILTNLDFEWNPVHKQSYHENPIMFVKNWKAI